MAVFVRKEEIWTQRPTLTRGYTLCELESRDRVILVQAKEPQRLSTNQKKLEERCGTDSPSQPSKETHPGLPWWDSG